VTEHPAAGAALRCWQSWHTQDLTAHDGLVVAGHAVIAESIAELQSPTSLTRLLRDPLGFVWKYALGWGAPDDRECPLILPPDEFGRLVHELLRRAVDALEPTPGFTVARTEEIEDALNAGVRHVITTWPLERPVPPEVLWVNTVRQAAAMALAGLTGERFTESGTRSWTRCLSATTLILQSRRIRASLGTLRCASACPVLRSSSAEKSTASICALAPSLSA
jgi:hypothetical protein